MVVMLLPYFFERLRIYFEFFLFPGCLIMAPVRESNARGGSVQSYFIKQVNEFIANETAVLNSEDKEGRFLIHQTAMQMVKFYHYKITIFQLSF